MDYVGVSSLIPTASSNSMFRTGPVNLWRALTSHQMPTAPTTISTVTGAELNVFRSKSSFHGTAVWVGGSENSTTQIATQTTAIGLIHLYFFPSDQGPASQESPFRQRRYTGIT